MINTPRTILALLLCLGSVASAQRYLQPVFSTIEKTANIAYGSNVNYKGANETLLLDFYEPQGDTIYSRPLVIFVHGGGFVGGDKGTSQFVTLCTEFAKRGYVTASINYRLDTNATPRAVMNAMHDARAAVRYFRKRANIMRLDTTRFAMGGGSAGAYTSLCVAFIDKQSELYPGSGATDVEGASGTPGVSSKIHACLDYWGALAEVKAIESSDDPPLIIFHGTNDNTVPYANATKLDARATSLGLYHEFYPLEGEGHGPWNQMDSIVNATARFLYKIFFSTQTSIDPLPRPRESISITNFPNPFSDRTTIRIDVPRSEAASRQEPVRVFLCDMLGRKVATVFEGDLTPGKHEVAFNRGAFPNGVYRLVVESSRQMATHSTVITTMR